MGRGVRTGDNKAASPGRVAHHGKKGTGVGPCGARGYRREISAALTDSSVGVQLGHTLRGSTASEKQVLSVANDWAVDGVREGQACSGGLAHVHDTDTSSTDDTAGLRERRAGRWSGVVCAWEEYMAGVRGVAWRGVGWGGWQTLYHTSSLGPGRHFKGG